MVRLDTDPLLTPADVDGISGGSENICVCTSLICSGGINRDGRLRYYAHFIITLLPSVL